MLGSLVSSGGGGQLQSMSRVCTYSLEFPLPGFQWGGVTSHFSKATDAPKFGLLVLQASKTMDYFPASSLSVPAWHGLQPVLILNAIKI